MVKSRLWGVHQVSTGSHKSGTEASTDENGAHVVKDANPVSTAIYLVPKRRLELLRADAHYALNVACLPIPPLRHEFQFDVQSVDAGAASSVVTGVVASIGNGAGWVSGIGAPCCCNILSAAVSGSELSVRTVYQRPIHVKKKTTAV